MQTTVIDETASVCLSVTWAVCANTSELTDVLLGVDTLNDHETLNRLGINPHPPTANGKRVRSAFTKLLWQLVTY